MNIEECKHVKIQNGICIQCGFCTDEITYVCDTYKEYRKYGDVKEMKYTVKQQFNKFEKPLIQILRNLDLMSYKLTIFSILEKVKFKYRVSIENRILIILYYVLKKDGCPIIISDLLKFTKLKKFEFLKMYRNTFGINLNSNEYLRSIYDRVINVWCDKGINTNIFTFENFLECKTAYPTIEAYSLGISCLIITSGLLLKKLNFQTKSHYEQIRKIIIKLKQDFILLEKNLLIKRTTINS